MIFVADVDDLPSGAAVISRRFARLGKFYGYCCLRSFSTLDNFERRRCRGQDGAMR